MNLLQRYLIKTMLMYTALVVLVVVGLDFVISLLAELRDLGTGDYGFWQAVQHTALRVPYSVYQFSPMLMLLGGLIGLGLLASNQELMVMRASGVSIKQLLQSVIIAALIMIVLATILGEVIAPRANFFANKQKDSAENGGQAVATAAGVWLHEGNNFLHIEHVLGANHLEGVTRYQFDQNHHLLAAYYVGVMEFEENEWQLYDVVKTIFLNDHTKSEQTDKTTWDLTLNPNLLNVGVVQADEMSLVKLKKYTRHMNENKQQATGFQFNFWKRVFQPLATLVMMLLAVPFVLSAPRSVTMGWRMLLGALVGFVFYTLNAFLGQLSVVYQLSPVVAAILPTLLFAGVGYGVLRISLTVKHKDYGRR